ncbi:hypothetical protein EX895_001625 [Sporisorium graminicola]|uniref:DNA/RNA-binding domain-containing protein n=1 Tax=Sporisorium graminicola TaxID=280036 RepID=A0A4U7KWH3_9BASI|nr:hypothetical protein EX895_001625 [Sporisorium graminicola]TKY89094.1 hypothetical protein EX895_001625 [Sporisorium graminicola]
MTTSTNAAMSQRDVRAAALLEQGRKQKAELDRMVKAAFAHSTSSSSTSSATSRAGRMHPKEPSTKLLDTEIDFARRNLRNTWLNLLFTCTFTREAQAVDGYIWNDTSYSLIYAYRSHISAAQKSVDPAMQAPGRRGKPAQDAARVKLEYRKFLVEEELFWQELVGRLVRLFSLDEARSNLEVLGIDADADNDQDSSISSSLPPDSYASRATRQNNAPDENLSQAALLPAKRIHLMTLLHKFLIFCGDLARYREMSSQDHETDASGGKKSKSLAKADFSRAVAFYEQARLILPDQGNPSNQLAVVSLYNGDTFATLYYYYRALCVKTPFAKAKVNLEKLLAKPTSLYLEEASRAAGGSLPVWDAARDRQARDAQLVARLSNNVDEAQQWTEAWIQQIITLHGLFYRRSHLVHIMYLSRSVLATFSTLLRARALRADQIVQFLVTALCASWTTRLWRGAPTPSSKESPRPSSGGSEDRHRPRAVRSERSSRKRASSPETGRCVEFQVTAHVLGVFRELAAVDTAETREAFEANKELAAALAQADGQSAPIRNLTAVVRRTLPALRIVTKWTKTHLEYLQRIEKRARDAMQQYGETDPVVVRSDMEVRPESERPDAHLAAYADTLESIDRAWSQYVDLINSLRYAFPFDSLPNIGKVGSVGAPALCLEEDSDMRGFAPTRKATQSTIPGGTTITLGMGEACANVEAVRPSQVHPNEEQLMRIADLMIDAKVIAESDASPIHFDDTNNTFVFERKREIASASHGSIASAAAAGAAAAAAAAAARQTVRPAPIEDAAKTGTRGAPQADAFKQVGGANVDSVEESMRDVQVRDNGVSAGGDANKTAEQLLVPSQVKPKAFQNKDDLARQLFAAYPLTTQSASGAGSSQMAPSSSNSSGSAHSAANPQDALLQMLSSQVGAAGQGRVDPANNLLGGGAGGHHANLLLSNGAPISSIWAPSSSDMGGLPPHLQTYAGRMDDGTAELYQRQLQQQQHLGYQQQSSWPNAGYLHQQYGAFPHQGGPAESYGNTTPDPFNPHGFGGAHLHSFHVQQQRQQQQQQQRRTPQPGNVHGDRLDFGNGQDPYYPGPSGAGASHSPRFS